MGIEERKEREKQHRKNVIVNSAEEVFAAKGVDQATMDEIAEKAELSKGTLYLYFNNKIDLYLAVCERGSNILNDRFSKLFAQQRNGLELIRGMGETYLNFIREFPHYLQAFLFFESMQNIEDHKDSDMVQTCEKNQRDALAYMVRALQVGMQDGSIDDSYDPHELAILIFGSTRGIVTTCYMSQRALHHNLLDEMHLDIGSMFESFLDLIGSGIQARPDHKND